MTPFKNLLRHPLILLFLILPFLSACGGESGMSLQSDVSVINITADETGQFQSHDFNFEILNNNSLVYIGVYSTTSAINSINYDLYSNPVPVNLYFNSPESLGVGNYTDQIYISACTDYNCNEHIAGSPKIIDVNLTVEPKLHVPYAFANFTRILGSTYPVYDIGYNIDGTNINWSATIDDESWVTIDANSGVSPSMPNISITDLSLPEGYYTTNMQLTNLDNPSNSLTIPINYAVVQPSFGATNTNINLGGFDSLTFNDSFTINVSVGTGTNAYPFTVTHAPNTWISTDINSGNISSYLTSDIAVSADRTGLSPGSHTETFNISVDVNGTILTRTVTVNLNLPAHDLLLSETGVALSSMPSREKLSHTVKVQDTYQINTTPWTAISDQNWLTVTASGLSDGDLVLTADPTGLTTDTVHYANVTLATTDASVGAIDSMRVGFWVGSSTPNAVDYVATTFKQIEADPIRPYAYAHNGGTNISIYNIHTAGLVGTINNVATALGDMVITKNGSKLFVYDETAQSVVPVNLTTLSVGTSWALASPSSFHKYLEILRVKGLEIILASNGIAYYPDTGNQVSIVAQNSTSFPLSFLSERMLASSHNGQAFCAQGVDANSSAMACYTLEYNRSNPEQVLMLYATLESTALSYISNVRDIALSPDGQYAYMAHNAPYNFTVYGLNGAPITQSLPGAAYPNNIEVMTDGRILAGISSLYGPADVRTLAADGTQLNSYYFSVDTNNTLARQLKLSGDGLRIISLTDTPNLSFVNTQ